MKYKFKDLMHFHASRDDQQMRKSNLISYIEAHRDGVTREAIAEALYNNNVSGASIAVFNAFSKGAIKRKAITNKDGRDTGHYLYLPLSSENGEAAEPVNKETLTAQIYKKVIDNPGATSKEIAALLPGYNPRSVERILYKYIHKDHPVLKSRWLDNQRRYYPSNYQFSDEHPKQKSKPKPMAKLPESGGMQSEIQEEILNVIRSRNGIQSHEIAKLLPMYNRSYIIRSIYWLRTHGFISRDGSFGSKTKYFVPKIADAKEETVPTVSPKENLQEEVTLAPMDLEKDALSQEQLLSLAKDFIWDCSNGSVRDFVAYVTEKFFDKKHG